MRFFILLLVFSSSVGMSRAQQLDKRAYNHFPKEEVDKILKDPVRVAKVNYLFQSSYQIIPSDSANAKPVDPAAVNVMEFDYHRYQDKPRTFYLTRMHDKIVLESRDDLEKAYRKIESSN